MIIWDADGVLIDSRAVAWSAAEAILRLFDEHNRIDSQLAYRQHFGRTAQARLVGEEGGKTLRALHRILMYHHRHQLRTFKEVIDIVPQLSTVSVIITASFANGVRDVLGGDSGHFAEIVGTETGPKKELLGVYARRSPLLCITDTITDISRCRTVGIKVCAVGWGYDTFESLRDARPDELAQGPENLRFMFARMGLLSA